MSLRLVALCVDANDPIAPARFWAEVLRWEIADETTEGVRLVPTDGTSFRIDFVPVAEPKVGKNRIHLDLTTTSPEDERVMRARLLELGARHIDIGQPPADDFVFADPEGNELCVIEPDNSFLALCGRVGAINCEGWPVTGYFWRDALGWPLVWDQDDETAIQDPGGTRTIISWSVHPGMEKVAKNRLHLEVAPVDGATLDQEVQRLLALGATHVDIGQGDVDWVVLADPDGNELCVLPPT
jgi:catechol 2,3-dioxygenase-like lactoylglutathione lyase family enzyme